MVKYNAEMAEFRLKYPTWAQDVDIPKETLTKTAALTAGDIGSTDLALAPTAKVAKVDKKFKNLFNKVVKLNPAGIKEAGNEYKYFYVLTYLPDLQWVQLGPLVKNGVFGSEKSSVEGRSKWVLVPEEENKEVDITASVCEIVRARGMKRTTDADDEEWDIADVMLSPLRRKNGDAKMKVSATLVPHKILSHNTQVNAASTIGFKGMNDNHSTRDYAPRGIESPSVVIRETVFRAVPYAKEGQGWKTGSITILDV
mmetsp:Transcript_29140/g.66808  ORF Transcript_29140/g.66808 Transcript_29140/m.66808 type:complete len:255 (+) Transcript_29140:2008-2772(+)